MKPIKKSNKYLTTAKIIVLSVILSAGISIVYGWTGPTAAPTGGNVAAPFNVGPDSQRKEGPAWFGSGMFSEVGAYVNGVLEVAGGFKLTGTSPAAGKVLKSDGLGNAAWATPNLNCVQRVVNRNVGFGYATADCLAGETLTGGGGMCTMGLISSMPSGPNSFTVTCGSTAEEVSAVATCCTMNFVTAI